MTSTPDLDFWRRAEILFEAALDRAPAERDAFLARACAEHPTLRDAVASLLRRDADGHPPPRPLVPPR